MLNTHLRARLTNLKQSFPYVQFYSSLLQKRAHINMHIHTAEKRNDLKSVFQRDIQCDKEDICECSSLLFSLQTTIRSPVPLLHNLHFCLFCSPVVSFGSSSVFLRAVSVLLEWSSVAGLYLTSQQVQYVIANRVSLYDQTQRIHMDTLCTAARFKM